MPKNIKEIRLWKDNPKSDNFNLVRVDFNFPCKWTIFNIEDLKKILTLWIQGEEERYPQEKGYQGRWMLFEEIKKIFGEPSISLNTSNTNNNNMKCQRCGYEWENRKDVVKQCPLCKRYLISWKEKKEAKKDDERPEPDRNDNRSENNERGDKPEEVSRDSKEERYVYTVC